MAYKDILVHLDNSPHCTARIDIAIHLAQEHGAHLTGLYVISHPYYRPQLESVAASAAETQAAFERATSIAGISAEYVCADWGTAGITRSEVINFYAYLKDLVIVGQSDPENPSDLPERVVVGSGRPVLIIPFAGSFSTVGERVMVCWKYGRESVRALNDAMPFLQQAEKIRVVAADPPEAAVNAGSDCCAGIRSYLTRHGIEGIVEQSIQAEIPIGDMLLNESWEEGCDLLVLGAFTRSAKGALILGPVARDVLDHMNLPVLMSH